MLARPISPRITTAAIETLESRQLLSGSTPFTGTPVTTNQTILAVNYDKGGEGVAYHDMTAANLGRDNYRYGDAVDIQTGGSSGNTIVYTAAGEWLNYTVKVPTAGTYTLEASVANVQAGGSFHAEFNGTNLTGGIAVANTGGWNTYSTVASGNFSLPAGQTVMRVVLDHAAPNAAVGNFDSFKLIPASTGTSGGGPFKPLVWTTKANALHGVFEAHSVAVGGKLYIFGGFDADKPQFEDTNTAEVYDLATNKWAYLANMPAMESHTATATDGTYIYVAGGYVYDPKTTWQTFGTTNVFRYDIAHNSWSNFVPLPEPRGGGELDLLNGKLHYFDGDEGVNTPNQTKVPKGDHWILNLNSAHPKWVTAAPALARNHASSVVLNGKIYVLGGRILGTDMDDPSADCLVWDPAKPNVWTHIADLPEISAVATAATYNGKIYLIGGTTKNYKAVANVYEYDPATNKWSTQTSIPEARFAPCCGVIGNQLIVTTGYHLTKGIFETTTWAATLT